MSGLVGFISNTEPHREGAALAGRLAMPDRTGSVRTNGETFFVEVRHHGLFPHSIIHETSEIVLVFDGWVRYAGGYHEVDTLDRVGANVARDGVAALTRLNGQFNAFVFDRRSGEAFLVNDRFGSRNLFYTAAVGSLAFAPEPIALGEAAPLDEEQVYNQIAFGRAWFGDSSSRRGVKALPPASVLTWRDGTATVEGYWRYRFAYGGAGRDETATEGVDLIREVVGDIVTGSAVPLAATLSGGLDSRFVIAAAPVSVRPTIACLTFGVSTNHAEVAIAGQVASLVGCPWHHIETPPAMFLRNAVAGQRIADGLDQTPQSFALEAFREAGRGRSLFIAGTILDVLFGGSYLDPAVIAAPDDHAGAKAYLARRLSTLSREAFGEFAKDPAGPEIWDAQRARLDTIYDDAVNDSAPDIVDEVVYRTRITRNLVMRQSWLRLFHEEIAPAYDHRVIDFVMSLAPSVRGDRALYRDMMLRLNPDVADVEYANTGLPLSAPLDYWARSAKLESARETLLRELYRDSGVFVPYKRYYSNFDEWLRFDPDWGAAVDDLLLGDGSILCQRYLKREKVADLVRRHRAAEAGTHRTLINLMSLETTLRAFADG